jgi:malate permease and related proteins
MQTLRLIALVVLFFVGLLLRRQRVLDAGHGSRLLQIVMWIGLPALILAGVSRLPLHAQLFWLPAAAMVTILLGCALSAVVGRKLELDAKAFGAFVTCSTALNIGLEYPFMLAVKGADGFAELALFDLGNTLMLCAFGYLLAAKLGRRAGTWWQALQRLGSFPPLWALVLALIINVFSLPVSRVALDTLQAVGGWVVLLVPLALGVLFDGRRALSTPSLAAVGIRLGIGLVTGIACVTLLDLHGLTRTVALVGSAAPIGFTVVVLTERESLDTELAASATSLSVLLGLLYIPLALLWLH